MVMVYKHVMKVLLIVMVMVPSALATSLDWKPFKTRFMASDGRILDTGNHNVSHTEGQGFSMLFAVAANDKASFDKIWGWTKAHLNDPKTGLFYWRYNPIIADPIEDKNNASDGDILIAWALLKAGTRWDNKAYLAESDRIVRALLDHTVIDFAHHKVMLPGRHGFTAKDSITLNPSYFIFPAWRDFAKRSYLANLWTLINDSQQLLAEIDWGREKIPTDWITLYANGKTAPAKKWPARVSYDAIRVPLYMKWDQANNPLLSRWQSWFSRYSRLSMPAWENMIDHQVANYPMRGGLLAVRDYTMGQLSQEATKIKTSDDYYSASLKLLSALADEGFAF